MSRRLALALWLFSLACAAGAILLVVTSDHEDSPLLTGLIASSVGVAFVTAGLVAWLRRPRNRTGALLTIVGFTWFLGSLTLADDSIPFTAGLALNNLVFAFFAWLVLAFPTGELTARLDRAVTTCTFALATVGQLGYLLVYDPREAPECAGCPPNHLQVTDSETLETAVRLAIDVGAVAIAVAFVTIIVRRWLAAAPATRRMLTPVYLTAGVTAVLIVVNFVAEVAAGTMAVGFWPVVYVSLLTVPLSFLYALLRTRLAQAEAGRLLLMHTPDEPTPHEAEEALRRTLQDPTLQLAYWLPESSAYVDAEGQPLELPRDDDTRAVTRIEYEDRPVAALIHDPALREEPELVESVVATVRVALEKDRSVQALRESERRRRALLDAMPDNMFRVSRDGGYLDANIKDERYLPVAADELHGKNVREVLPPHEAEQILTAVARAIDSGAPQTVEYRLRRPIGIRDSEARIVASGDDEAVIIVRDITQRKYQDALLEAERDFIRTVVDSAPALFAVVDAEGAVVRFNDALAELSGSDEDAARARPFWEVFVSPTDAEAVQARFTDAVERDRSPRHEHRWRTREEDEPAFVEWSLTRLPDQSGHPRYLVAGLDVTDRRRQDQELRRLYAELESRNRELQRERDFANTIADTTPSLLCVVSAEGRIVPHGVNPAFENALGWTEEEVTGRRFDELVLLEADRPRFRAVLEWLGSGGGGGEMETDWKTRDGRTLSAAWTLTPLQDRHARKWYLVSAVDMTERKRNAQELQSLYDELEERNRAAERERDFLNAIANNAPSMLCLIDETGVVAPAASNRAFEEALGYEPEETGGGLFWERYVVPGEAAEVRATIERVIAGEALGEHDSTWVTSGGETMLVAWSCTALPRLDDRTLFLITGVDVTERKRHEEELRASRQRIVEAGDAERRRLERNLHDGAQQRLVAISISLRLAKAKLQTDAAAAGTLLEAAAEELAFALEELRELARGIHPAILTDRGLHPALVSVASRSPVPVALEVTEERMPGPVEAAAYYVVSEALANVAKYADASNVSVTVARANGRAVVEVADDGVGGADPAVGSGLRGLADRVSALDGSLDVVSPPRRGTRIRAEIPLA